MMATTNKSARCHNSEDHNLSLQIHSLQFHTPKTTFPAEFITIFILLRYGIVSLVEWRLTFQGSTFVSSSLVRKSSEDFILHWNSQTLKMKPAFCPKTLCTNHSVTQHHVSYPRVTKTSTTSQQKPKISRNWLFCFRRTRHVFKLNTDSGNLLKKIGNTIYTKWLQLSLV
jgi:hypothetical protein